MKKFAHSQGLFNPEAWSLSTGPVQTDNTGGVSEFQVTRCGDVRLSSSQKHGTETGPSHRNTGAFSSPAQGGHPVWVPEVNTDRTQSERLPCKSQTCPWEPGTSKRDTEAGNRQLCHQAETWGPPGRAAEEAAASAFPGVMATSAGTGDQRRALCTIAVSLGAGLRPSSYLRRETMFQ